MRIKQITSVIFFLLLFGWLGISGAYAADPLPPASVAKLIFIHHSTGGNWLADPNEEQPYGGLGAALMNNNYYVSAANYGWGPDSIGDRTNIPDWPEWFTGQGSTEILAALYAENDQNIEGFGAWSRLGNDPGGDNEIIMFKSCYPNSDLFGEPDDPPASEPNDQYTVSNAKAVYNNLLTYFQTRPDKLFVVITAPPQNQNEYAEDYQTPAHRAANARAFNNWLVNDWLSGYPYRNVCVFDYFNILTGQDNHHRYHNGAVEHVVAASSNFAAYPNGEWDSHPSTAGQQKATEEFVPLLNYYYNQFSGSPPSPAIRANGTQTAITVSTETPVSITISLDPGAWAGQPADSWVAALTPFGWFSYIRSAGWAAGIQRYSQAPLVSMQSTEILNMPLPFEGNYDFYFVIDNNADGVPNVTWFDGVRVTVQ